MLPSLACVVLAQKSLQKKCRGLVGSNGPPLTLEDQNVDAVKTCLETGGEKKWGVTQPAVSPAERNRVKNEECALFRYLVAAPSFFMKASFCDSLWCIPSFPRQCRASIILFILSSSTFFCPRPCPRFRHLSVPIRN